jgi:diacylglycerol kinase family enzyme
MTRPVLIIANPVSGGGRGGRLAHRLARALAEHGLQAEIRPTTVDCTGRTLAARTDTSEFRTIAVVGGDGSLRDVVSGLRDLAMPVALLPAGTANVWAHEARIPRSPERVAGLVNASHTIPVELGEANGKVFLLFVGAGIDARIVRRVEERRRRLGHKGGMAQWIAPGWAEFICRPLADLAVTVEGQRLEGLAQILVTRIRSYAGMMSMPAGIDIADGKLHVLAFGRRRKPLLAIPAWRAVRGRLRAGRDVTHVVTDGPIRIESTAQAEPYHVDGDHAGDLPVDIALSGRRVLLVVPNAMIHSRCPPRHAKYR